MASLRAESLIPLDATLLRNMLDTLLEGVYIMDRQRVIQFWNKGAETITGFSAVDVLGHCCSANILNHVDRAGTNLCKHGCPAQRCMTDGMEHTEDIYLHHKEGHRVPVRVRTAPLFDDAEQVIGAVESFLDITQRLQSFSALSRDEAARKLDTLTGLGNKAFAKEKLDEQLSTCTKVGGKCGAALITIDRFDELSERLPREVTQILLKMVAQTIRHDLAGSDFAARWGYDQFLVLFPGVDASRLTTLARRLCILISQSSRSVSKGHLQVTASIGGTLIQPSDDLDRLLSRLQLYLNSSQRNGGNCVSL